MTRYTTSILLLAGCLAGCTELPPELDSVCAEIGACAPIPLAPVALDVACDASDGSTCSRRTAEETLNAALCAIEHRPGSVLRVWAVGSTIAEVSLVFEASVPQVPARVSAAARRREEFRADALADALDALETAFGSGREQRGSPLSDAIARVAAEDAHGLPRTIVLVSDGREHRPGLDFERGHLPTEARFLANLTRRRVLESGSLVNVRIHFAFLTLGPLARRAGTDVSLGRRASILDLWRAALERAGAADVTFSTGPPRFDFDARDSAVGTVLDADDREDRNERSL